MLASFYTNWAAVPGSATHVAVMGGQQNGPHNPGTAAAAETPRGRTQYYYSAAVKMLELRLHPLNEAAKTEATANRLARMEADYLEVLTPLLCSHCLTTHNESRTTERVDGWSVILSMHIYHITYH